MNHSPPPPPPLPNALVQIPRIVGVVALASAIGLAIKAPAGGALDTASPWWSLWISTAGAGMVSFPLSMLLLWRNGRKVPDRDADGAPRLDPRGRPRTVRVELRGSRVLFIGLALQAASLLVLTAALLFAAGL